MEKLDPSDLQLLSSASVFQRYSFNAHERHCLFVNGRGQRFFEAGYALGVDLDLEGRGAAVADLDQDGALDLVVRNVRSRKIVYLHNETAGLGHFLRVSLTGTRSNRDAVGTVARLVAGGLRQMRVKVAGSGFQSQSEGTLHFGLGAARTVDELRIEWPSGLVETFRDLPADRLIAITEGAGTFHASIMPGSHGEIPKTAESARDWNAWYVDGRTYNRPAGQPTIVSLWASWCLPCRKEVPLLNELYKTMNKQAGFAAIGLEENAESAEAFANATKATYPMLFATEESLKPLLGAMFDQLDVRLPAIALLDASGRPVRVFKGDIPMPVVARELAALSQAESSPKAPGRRQ